MDVYIRHARATDADEIVRLTNQLGYDLSTSDATETIRRIISREDQQVLVAMAGDRPIAWVHAAILDLIASDAIVVIAGLVVDKCYRRQGIARTLMEHVETWAKSRGCFIIRLSSSSTRTGAHHFYEQIGYQNIKTQYAFIKTLEGAGDTNVKRFVPRVDG